MIKRGLSALLLLAFLMMSDAQTVGDNNIDEISYRNLNVILKEVKSFAAREQYDSAAILLDKALIMSDSLLIRYSQTEVMAFRQLLEKQEQIYQRNVLLNWLVSLLVILALTVAIIVYGNRIIRRRYKAYMQVINGLEAYRDESPVEEEATDNVDVAEPDIADTATQGQPEKEPQDEDERLFQEMDRRVTREKLFLQPDLDREKLMQLIGVDKNRFGRLISKYSDASNASVYINTKRVEYGAQQIALHPEFTIASIAESCGMRNTVTFNRTFKEVYGVTPSEYRANLNGRHNDGAKER